RYYSSRQNKGSREKCFDFPGHDASRSEHISDGTGKAVAAVAAVGEGTDSKERASNAGRSLRNRPETVVEEVIELENHSRRGGDIKTHGCAGTVKVEIRDRTIKPDYFVSEDGRDIATVIEFLGEEAGREWEVVGAFDVKAILAGRRLGDELGQCGHAIRVIRVQTGRGGALGGNSADEVETAVVTGGRKGTTMMGGLDDKAGGRPGRVPELVKAAVVGGHSKLQAIDRG